MGVTELFYSYKHLKLTLRVILQIILLLWYPIINIIGLPMTEHLRDNNITVLLDVQR